MTEDYRRKYQILAEEARQAGYFEIERFFSNLVWRSAKDERDQQTQNQERTGK